MISMILAPVSWYKVIKPLRFIKEKHIFYMVFISPQKNTKKLFLSNP